MSSRGSRRRTRSNTGDEEQEDLGVGEGNLASSSTQSWSDIGEGSPNSIQTPSIEEESSEEEDITSSRTQESPEPSALESRVSGATQGIMTDAEEDPTDPPRPPVATEVTLGGVTVHLNAVNTVNDTSTVIKPLVPKEQWADLPPDARRKVFDAIKKSVLDEKMSMVTIVATDLESMEDTVNIQDKIAKLIHHIHLHDLDHTFQILQYDRKNPWDPTKYVTVDLLERLTLVSPETVASSNRFLRRYADHTATPYLEDSLNLTFELFQNNCDDTLNGKIFEEYSRYPEEEQGGNLYFALMLKLTYRNAEEECQHLSNVLSTFQVTSIQGECITNFTTHVRSVVKFLKSAHVVQTLDGGEYHKYIRADLADKLLDSLQTTSTPEFNEVFKMTKNMLTVERHGTHNSTSTDETVFTSIEEILDLAQEHYLTLVSQGKWNGVTSPGQSSFLAGLCWNCGGQGHMAHECPKPKNEQAIARNRKQQGRGGPGRGGGGRGRGKGKGPSGKWAPPTAAEHNKRVIDGVPHHYNPAAHEGKGRWFPIGGGPKDKKTPAGDGTREPGANLATNPPVPGAIPQADGASLGSAASGLTAATLQTLQTQAQGGSVTQDSHSASLKKAEQLALVSSMKQNQDNLSRQLDAFVNLN